MKTQSRGAAEMQSGELDSASPCLGDSALDRRDAASPVGEQEHTNIEDGFNVFDAVEMPTDWRMERLGDIATRVTGGGTPSTKVSEYWDGDIPWTTSAVIGEEDIYLTKHQRCITPKGLEESSTQLIPKGSVLIGTRVGVGKAAVTTCDIAISQDLTALMPKPGVSAEFIALVLKFAPVVSWFEENKRGTTIKGVSRNDVLRLMVPFPGFPEQRGIAGVLRTVQGAKEACERVLAATRQLKQSLLHHLFTYGPVPLAHAAHVQQRELESGVFPATWIVKRFDEFATLQRGQDLARWEFKSGTVPVIGATTAIGYHDTANVKGPGVTVVRSGSSAGKPLFVDRDFWAHNVVLYVKDFHGNDPKFVFYMLLVLGLTKFRSGVAVPTLNRNTFSGIQIAVPPLTEQRAIAAQLAAVDAKLAAGEARRAALAAVFQSLLRHLMTGKVRLPEFAKGQP